MKNKKLIFLPFILVLLILTFSFSSFATSGLKQYHTTTRELFGSKLYCEKSDVGFMAEYEGQDLSYCYRWNIDYQDYVQITSYNFLGDDVIQVDNGDFIQFYFDIRELSPGHEGNKGFTGVGLSNLTLYVEFTSLDDTQKVLKYTSDRYIPGQSYFYLSSLNQNEFYAPFDGYLTGVRISFESEFPLGYGESSYISLNNGNILIDYGDPNSPEFPKYNEWDTTRIEQYQQAEDSTVNGAFENFEDSKADLFSGFSIISDFRAGLMAFSSCVNFFSNIPVIHKLISFALAVGFVAFLFGIGVNYFGSRGRGR